MQSLARNIVTQNTPDIQVSGVFGLTSAHMGITLYRSAPLVSVRQISICRTHYITNAELYPADTIGAIAEENDINAIAGIVYPFRFFNASG